MPMKHPAPKLSSRYRANPPSTRPQVAGRQTLMAFRLSFDFSAPPLYCTCARFPPLTRHKRPSARHSPLLNRRETGGNFLLHRTRQNFPADSRASPSAHDPPTGLLPSEQANNRRGSCAPHTNSVQVPLLNTKITGAAFVQRTQTPSQFPC